MCTISQARPQARGRSARNTSREAWTSPPRREYQRVELPSSPTPSSTFFKTRPGEKTTSRLCRAVTPAKPPDRFANALYQDRGTFEYPSRTPASARRRRIQAGRLEVSQDLADALGGRQRFRALPPDAVCAIRTPTGKPLPAGFVKSPHERNASASRSALLLGYCRNTPGCSIKQSVPESKRNCSYSQSRPG